MADLPVPLLDGYDGHTLHRPLAEHRAEMAVELLTWSRIDDLDLASVNDALHTHPRLGGSTAVSRGTVTDRAHSSGGRWTRGPYSSGDRPAPAPAPVAAEEVGDDALVQHGRAVRAQ
ncbi:hypothetical protein [Frankia sp. Cas4]|uniref:hypothetical protein n=1 Tax=Frankia sp. Cas4 TaxID=3073927 RepID=UPI002AD20DB4|nr:hypothetical protein [Frankia sp. Cas4]